MLWVSAARLIESIIGWAVNRLRRAFGPILALGLFVSIPSFTESPRNLAAAATAMDRHEVRKKVISLSVRHRTILHRLLHRELGKCSVAVLSTFQRCGWICGEGGGYELTAVGRQLAEYSENAVPDRELELQMS